MEPNATQTPCSIHNETMAQIRDDIGAVKSDLRQTREDMTEIKIAVQVIQAQTQTIIETQREQGRTLIDHDKRINNNEKDISIDIRQNEKRDHLIHENAKAGVKTNFLWKILWEDGWLIKMILFMITASGTAGIIIKVAS